MLKMPFFRSPPLGGRAAHVDAAGSFGALVVVSYYTPGGYYEEKALQLRAQCDRFGLRHDIVEIVPGPGEDWAAICRRKVSFYREMLRRHGCAIMWLDADTVLLNDIGHLHQGHFDIALFMRGFRFLPQYNPAMFARTFAPGYLLFRHTPTTLKFLDDCIAIDAAETGAVTDDYILEEAFRTSTARPRLMILSPSDIARPGDEDRGGAIFLHGDSGHVDEFRDRVRQHAPRWQSADVQRAVLGAAVSDAAREGNRSTVQWLLRRQLRIDPGDAPTFVKLIEVLERAGDAAALAAAIEAAQKSPELRPFALRHRLVRALLASDWTLADRLHTEIDATGHPAMIAFARSRTFRHSLDRRAEALGVPDAARPSLYWWEEPYPGNLGDIVNPYVVEGVTGAPPRYAPKGRGICAIGSVIKYAASGTPVWGSGSPNAEATLAPDARYLAVRGPLTRELVLRNGGECPPVYGDPAWLLPILYRPEVRKTSRTGLILHYVHEGAPLEVAPTIRRIGIRRVGYTEIEAFLDELLSCERIVSSSLHGVIIAQAYGIPAALATVSNARRQVHGDGVKFRDYFLSVGIDWQTPPIDLSNLGLITDESFSDADFLPVRRPIQLSALLAAAPFPVRAEVAARARSFDGR